MYFFPSKVHHTWKVEPQVSRRDKKRAAAAAASSGPIPTEPPRGPIFPNSPKQPPLLHGLMWDKKTDLTGWWLCEKMDGVRGYWDGQKLYSRAGNEFPAPPFFIEGLPNFPLDGELWMGRNTFEKLISTLKSKEGDWKNVKYTVFDLPSSNEPYEARQEALKKIPLPAHVSRIEVIKCEGPKHLKEYVDTVMSTSGEGVIANAPNSPYVAGRVNTLVKVKPFEDAEVRLVEVLPTGLKVEQPNGLQVMIQCFQQVINDPPKIGAILTVKHAGHYNNGRLKHPYFWRERNELSWEQVKSQFAAKAAAEAELAS